ncbi:PAS domain S-box protein [Candidatus Pacearchaeota archaeon]|nr:PAS domain S-box protein [Candidatus Pacearchaeota archaeon]
MEPLKEIKVLYVEDDEDHAKLIGKMLKKCERIKFEVKYRGDLQSSITYLNSIDCNVDVILLDLILPNSEGVDTFIEVYNNCKLPIVIISGFGDIAYSCIALGAQDYLVKPDISPALVARSLEYAIERYRANKEIKESQKRFKLLTEANFEGVTITKNGIILDVNEQFAKMFRLPVEEIIGLEVMEFVASEDKELVLTNLSRKYEYPYEHTARRKDGTKFPVEIHGRSLPDGLRLTAIRDMTRYKESEEALKEAEREKEKIFSQLETKIYEWRQERAKTSILQQHTIRKVSKEIESITNSGGER